MTFLFIPRTTSSQSSVKESTHSIGWSRIKLFNQEDNGGATTWKLMTGDCVYRLHAGNVPENVSEEDSAQKENSE